MSTTDPPVGDTAGEAESVQTPRRPAYLHFLLRDPFALASAIWLLFILLCATVGPLLLDDAATDMNLRARNLPLGSIENSWLGILGYDPLGRSVLARSIVATQTTLGIAAAAALAALFIGTVVGLYAGYIGGRIGRVIMQLSDIVQSFPSLLLALFVLYMLEPRPLNIVLVLAFGQIPIYLRVARAEVLELRERLFVDAARVLGARSHQILARHIGPLVLPVVINIVTIDFALIMLSESSLSFLGLGVQAPSITWGVLVAQGREYLQSAWWISFFPGLMIMLTTLSINLLANWLRRVRDPRERWRFDRARHTRKRT
ncbi:MAG: ABC transporter permease [Azospirillaceae bacterium]